MTTKVGKEDLLKVLIDNRAKHSKIVTEARKGYTEKARAALKRKLDDIETGKIVALDFSLRPPVNYTDVYDTAILMLEMHTDDTVILEANEFRNLVQDQWDWTSDFYATNKQYSMSASATAEEKGY